ncbi:hypothetical protein SKAU_G00426240 [Synaphobranchus kaupii]|uniref:Uncharacterized protein n=1 Tax=Synaphobranchus kaupii TaxID=118154 RepID=A0A9Q1E562_SYNKA|nr:hypothetical protein SKAU_G00426240 [Synaphobranchus kaupii]
MKAANAANVKLFSITRKEGPNVTTITSTREQSPNTRPKTLSGKGEIPHSEESGHRNTQRGSVIQMNGEAFSFSFPETRTPSKASTVKQAVLRNISRMLEENRNIRRRLTGCNQERDTGTEWINRL